MLSCATLCPMERCGDVEPALQGVGVQLMFRHQAKTLRVRSKEQMTIFTGRAKK